MTREVDDLARRFSALGARDPDAWARSQIEEGLPQLARYLFLRQAWRGVIPDDSSWIAPAIASSAANPGGPGGELGPALARVVEKCGAEDVTTVVRVMQWRVLASLSYLLDDPNLGPEAEDVSWRLFQVDPDSGEPIVPIAGLHESVLEVEPTGREMRPASGTEQAKGD